jgi:hypothetical protein
MGSEPQRLGVAESGVSGWVAPQRLVSSGLLSGIGAGSSGLLHSSAEAFINSSLFVSSGVWPMAFSFIIELNSFNLIVHNPGRTWGK